MHIGSFFPEDKLERYQRVDHALVDVAGKMYATGEFFSRLREGRALRRAARHRRQVLGALEEVFPGARYQRRAVNFYCNVLGRP